MKRIINILIIASLLILNIFFIFQNLDLKREISILNQKIVNLEKQKTESKPPIGWKEYTDKKYKFKVWYPGETIYEILIFKDDKDPMPYVRGFQIDDHSIIDGQIVLGEGTPRKLLGIYKDITDIKKFIREDLWRELKGSNAAPDNTDKYINSIDQYTTQVKISGIDAYKIELLENIVNYYIKKDNLVFNLNFDNSLHLPETSAELRPYFDQMIQSFRFID